jgi:hypothetical protein
MSAPNLKPWSLRPLGIAGVILFCIFTVAVVTLMIHALPTMRIRVLSKVLFVIGAVATLGFALTLAMWHRHWKEVARDIGFWLFITGPAPSDAYPEAIQAWLGVDGPCVAGSSWSSPSPSYPSWRRWCSRLTEAAHNCGANHGDAEQGVEADEGSSLEKVDTSA